MTEVLVSGSWRMRQMKTLSQYTKKCIFPSIFLLFSWKFCNFATNNEYLL